MEEKNWKWGWDVCKEHPIPASPLTLPLALLQEEAGRRGPQTPGLGLFEEPSATPEPLQ